MLRLELSRLADADIASMIDYGVAEFGWPQAKAYAESFETSFSRLREYPHIGRAHPELTTSVRSWPHGNHRIFYTVEGEAVIVRRILHKSMDALRHLD